LKNDFELKNKKITREAAFASEEDAATFPKDANKMIKKKEYSKGSLQFQ
jgi:hypothetical protein